MPLRCPPKLSELLDVILSYTQKLQQRNSAGTARTLIETVDVGGKTNVLRYGNSAVQDMQLNSSDVWGPYDTANSAFSYIIRYSGSETSIACFRRGTFLDPNSPAPGLMEITSRKDWPMIGILMTMNATGTTNNGDLLKVDPNNNKYVVQVAEEGALGVVGVRHSSGDMLTYGFVRVVADGAITRGDLVQSSATAGRVKTLTLTAVGDIRKAVGTALESAVDAGYIWIFFRAYP